MEDSSCSSHGFCKTFYRKTHRALQQMKLRLMIKSLGSRVINKFIVIDILYNSEKIKNFNKYIKRNYNPNKYSIQDLYNYSSKSK